VRGNGEGRDREVVAAHGADEIEEPSIAIMMVLVTSVADGI